MALRSLRAPGILRRAVSRLAYAKEFLILATVLLVVVALLAALTYTGVQVLASVRTFVNGEALYSKAQKDAVYQLSQYVRTQRPEYFTKYEEAIAIPLGFRAARLELEQSEPSLDTLRAALRQGRLEEADLPTSVRPFQVARRLPPMATAMQLWAEADQLVFDLDQLARALEDEMDRPAPRRRAQARAGEEVLQEVDRLNLNLTNIEAAFSRTLAEAARWVQAVVVWSVIAGALLLLLLAIGSLNVVLTRLKSSQEKFRRLFEQSRDAIVLIAPDGSVAYANPAAYALFGYTHSAAERDAFRAFRVENLFAHAQQRWAFLEAVQSSGAVADFEAEMVQQDGTHLIALLTATHIQDQSGTTVGYETIIRDVTERRQTEARMRLLERAVEASGNAIFLSDAGQPGNPLVYVNPAFERVTGYRADEAIGRSLSFLYNSSPDEVKVLRDALRSGRISRIVLHSTREDGSVRWSELSIAPVHGAEGKLLSYVGVQTDITESKQAEEALLQALLKEKELSELRSRFVAMVSHEFRTPLATILSSAELVERFRTRWPEDRLTKHLHRIQGSVQVMTNLLENVLAAGKAEAGRLQFHPTRTDLGRFVREIAEETWNVQGQRHQLRLGLPTEPVMADIDPDLLRYALSNLVSNAVKYSPEGSTVTVSAAAAGRDVVIRVADEGIGIPDEDLPHIFDPFHRGSNAGPISGTGLGLFITRRALEMHNGSIALEPRGAEAVGTAFVIRLPRYHETGTGITLAEPEVVDAAS